MDDYHLILVDGTKSVPIVVWVTSSVPRPVLPASRSLGTDDHAIPSLNEVVHSFSGRVLGGSGTGTDLLN